MVWAVDADDSVPVFDPTSDKLRDAEVLLGVLGEASYVFAEAGWT
ncbi:MAG: hypothetical protein AAF293_02510 [Pseudomonadota bacterium]